MGEESFRCSFDCSRAVESFYFEGSEQRLVCAVHSPSGGQLFPAKAAHFVSIPSDYSLYLARESEVEKATQTLETVRHAIAGAQAAAVASLQRSQSHLHSLIDTVFASEQRKTLQFYHQLTAQLGLLSQQFRAYQTDKKFHLSPVALAAIRAEPDEYGLRCEVGNCELEVAQSIAAAIVRPELPPESVIAALLDSEERSAQCLTAVQEASALKLKKYPQLKRALFALKSVAGVLGAQEVAAITEELDEKVTKCEKARRQELNGLLAEDCPSAARLAGIYLAAIAAPETPAQKKKSLCSEFLTFVGHYSESRETAKFYSIFASLSDTPSSHLQTALDIQIKLSPSDPDTVEFAERLMKAPITDMEKTAEWCQQAMKAVEEYGAEGLVGRCRYLLGRVCRKKGQHSQAIEEYERALKSLEKESNSALLELTTRYKLGLSHATLGHSSEAICYLEQSLSTARSLCAGSRLFIKCLLRLSISHLREGRLQEALALSNEAAEAVSAHSDSLLKAQVLEHLGAHCLFAKKLDDAVRVLTTALELRERLTPDSDRVLMDINNIGNALMMQRRFSAAVEIYQRALSVEEKHPKSVWLILVRHSLGTIYINQGQLSDALPQFQRCCELLDQRNSRSILRALALNNIGLSHTSLDAAEQAEDAYHKALEFLAVNYPEEVTVEQVRGNLAVLYHNHGNLQDAIEMYSAAIERLEQFNERFGAYSTLLLYNCGKAYFSLGDLEHAEMQFLAALAKAEGAKVDISAKQWVSYFALPKSPDEADKDILLPQGVIFSSNVLGETNELLGHLYRNTNREEEAERRMAEAARVYEAQGRNTEAARLRS